MVLKVGLEPTRHSTPVPKTGVAAITPLEHMYISLGLKSRRTLINLTLVPLAGLEPARYFYQGIFLLLYVTIASDCCCSLDYVFTIFYNLGGRYIVSTHLVLAHTQLGVVLIGFSPNQPTSHKKFPILWLFFQMTNIILINKLPSAFIVSSRRS